MGFMLPVVTFLLQLLKKKTAAAHPPSFSYLFPINEKAGHVPEGRQPECGFSLAPYSSGGDGRCWGSLGPTLSYPPPCLIPLSLLTSSPRLVLTPLSPRSSWLGLLLNPWSPRFLAGHLPFSALPPPCKSFPLSPPTSPPPSSPLSLLHFSGSSHLADEQRPRETKEHPKAQSSRL